MFLLLLTAVILLGATNAQTTYDCNCGFFVFEQGPGQVGDASPIPFKAETLQVDPNACNEPVAGNNTCKYLCDEWGKEAAQSGFTYCSAQDYSNSTGDGIARCFGGLYCEALFQDDRIPEEGGLETSMRMWYRMPQCPESTDHNDWSLATYEYPEALCCTSLGTYDSCYEACDCIKGDPARYCECGVFSAVQFQSIPDGDTYQPLPFRMASDQVGDTPFSFCDNYEADAFDEECGLTCLTAGDAYFATFDLIDSAHLEYNVDEGVSYGDLYCSSLRSRNIFYDTYINTQVRMYKRAPLCFPGNEWKDPTPLSIHPERLCCNELGEFEYPCPTVGRAEPKH